MIKGLYHIILIVFLFCFFKSQAQYLEFVENKGQWAETISYQSNFSTGSIALKKDGAYRIMLHNAEDLEAMHEFHHPSHTPSTSPFQKKSNNVFKGLRSHVYEVTFIGANKNPDVIPDKRINTYNNYYLGNDSSKWTNDCKIFQAVTYKNIYPNIDVRYYTTNGVLKYDFIVKKGGNPANIILQYDGVEGLKVKQNELIIKTSVAIQKDLAPYTFQPSNEGKKEIDCRYNVIGNLVSFKVSNYDVSSPLIIDPTMIFASLSGSSADNWGFTATYDEQGNFYGGGIVFSPGNFPVTNGSTFQGGSNDDEEGGSYDISIIKLNALGNQRLYATYIGGSGNDQPHSLVTNANGDLYISGRTVSSNYPRTFPVSGVGGARDIIITSINNQGNIIASRVIGGSADDGINIKPKYSNNPAGASSLVRNYGDDARSEILIDNLGNVMLASCTQSTNFFVTPNALQSTNGGASSTMQRKQDGVFLKLTSNLSSFLTSTYLGGSDDDAAFVLTQNPLNNNIYIAGATASTDFPGDKVGTIGVTYNGGICDGFIAVLNSTGTQLLQSTYLGTPLSESIYGIQFDKKGFLYFTGTTLGNWLVLNATYSNAGAKQFISKIQANLSAYVYSTTFGTNSSKPNISITAFLVDRCENVYVSGWGGNVNESPQSSNTYPNSGTTGLPITVDAIQKTTDGSDFYFFVLERNARSQLYGSFFGQNGGIGEHVDGGTSRFNRNGIIYQTLCANCGGRPKPDFPATNGAFSTTNLSANCNLGAVKIDLNLSGVGAGVRSSIRGVSGDTSGCVPLSIRFQDTLAQGQKYYWNFGDGSPIVITTKPDTNHTYTRIGEFRVCVVSIDSTSCNIADTSCRIMRIRSDSSKLRISYTKIGNCLDNLYQFDNTASSFPLGKPFKNNSFLINFGDGTTPQLMGYQNNKTHQYPAAGTYKGWMALVDTNYCNTPDTAFFEIEVVVNVKASFNPPPKGCLSKPITFSNASSGAQTYLWNFGDGTTSNLERPSHLFTNTGNYTIRLYAFNSTSCNKVDSMVVNFEISVSPYSIFSYNPVPPRVNTPVNFINQSIGAVRYQWSFGDGSDTVKTTSKSPIAHLYQMTKQFNACLVVYNLFNCTDTSCQPINARVNQLFDLPSAFTPNGDGKNDVVYVRGFGIKKINWQIFNRWGTLIFTSNSIDNGWDGKFKGELQPQEVYHYTLQVEFLDDSKDFKSGDITLLR
jgi:gliding motility-associated-like protein